MRNGYNFVHLVRASYEPDDDTATIVVVTLPADEPGLLQPVEHPCDRPGGKSGEIGELTSSRWSCAIQDIHDLHVRDGHPEPSRRRSEKGRGKGSRLPQLPR